MIKKTLKIALITLIALIGIAFAAPFLFKGKIMALAKKELNNSLNAKADFSNVDISFFRHFPRVAVGLQNLQITGLHEFSGDTLISTPGIDLAVNLLSVLKGNNYQVHSITINNPRIHAIVNKEGKANWDIFKPDTAAPVNTTEKPFRMQLDAYEIKNGYISYDDEQGNMSSEVVNINHRGSGDFNADLFTLKTITNADAVSFTYNNIPYLHQVKTSVKADVQVDNKTGKYSFQTDNIQLNELPLQVAGFFQLVDDTTYGMDINFKAPSADFRHILSLVPMVYQENFAKVKTTGQAAFNGFVKGRYSPQQMPAYNVNLDIKDGFFQYPDLPKPVQHIDLILHLNNPDGVTDHTVVEIPKGHIEFGNDPFDFHFILKNPLSDRYLDAGAKGKLDLAQVSQFIKLAEGTRIAGLLDADIDIKGNIAALQKQQAGEFSGKGFVNINNLYYTSKSFPEPIQNTRAKIIVESPDGVADHTVISIPASHVEVGTDKADISLLLKNPISDPYFDGTVKGGFDLSKIKQFYTFEKGTSLSGMIDADIAFTGRKSMIDKKQYEAIQTNGTLHSANINYKSVSYPEGAQIKTAELGFTPRNITLGNLVGTFMKTNFSGSGSFDNVIGYVLKDEPLTGTLNLVADKLNLNEWMGSDTATTNASQTGTPFAVPKNLNLNLTTKVANITYDKVAYNNVTGSLLLVNEAAQLKNVSTETLGGTMALNGSYSTLLNKLNPEIALTYDVKNLDVQKTFLAYNTVQKLMPIAQFLDGKLSSQLTMTGKLGQDMFPQLGSLTGNGNMLLIEGFLRKFAPLEKLASLIDVKALENVSMRDVKNYISFANGKVAVKPFKLKVNEIEMEIGGMHGFDQSIEYIVSMKVPRAMMGEKGNALVSNLATQVSSKGIPLKLGDVVNLHVKIGGTIKNPILTTDLKQTAGSIAEELKQQAVDMVKAKADSTKTAVTTSIKDTMAAVKKQVLKDAEDELKKRLFSKSDTSAGNNGTGDTKKKVEESAKGLLKDLNPFKKKKKATDSLPN